MIELGKDVAGEAEETRLVSAESMAAEHRGKLESFILTSGAVGIGLWGRLNSEIQRCDIGASREGWKRQVKRIAY